MAYGRLLLCFLIGSLVAFLFPQDLAQAEDNPQFTICKLQKEVRTIRIDRDPESKVCYTKYSKYGNEQSVAEGHNPVTCDEASRKIRVNLEAAGWKCREVQNATSVQEE